MSAQASVQGILRATTSGRCRYCHCTDERACDEGCSWFDREHTLCDNPNCIARLANALLKLAKKKAVK